MEEKLYVNKTGENRKLRFDEPKRPGMYGWKNIKKGEEVMCLPTQADALGLTLKKEKVEAAPLEPGVGVEAPTKDVAYAKKLKAIRGIGNATLKDIMIAYPKEDVLVADIKNGGDLPFRDDVVALLKKAYGVTDAEDN